MRQIHFTPNSSKCGFQGPFEVLRLDMWSRARVFISALEGDMLIKCFLLGSIADECGPGFQRKLDEEEAGIWA